MWMALKYETYMVSETHKISITVGNPRKLGKFHVTKAYKLTKCLCMPTSNLHFNCRLIDSPKKHYFQNDHELKLVLCGSSPISSTT